MDLARHDVLRPSDDAVWRLTFEHSPVGMAVVGLDGRWLEVNRALSRMLGRPVERLLQLTFEDLTHPDDLDAGRELVDACLSGRLEEFRMVKRYRHADGNLIWGDLSVTLVRDELGAPLHFVAQVLDVTQQRADRERLEEVMQRLSAANVDLEQYAGVVSHDLKTPLTTVRASLEMLLDELPDDDGLPADLARQAVAATERMNALIDALLAYSTTDPRNQARPGHEAAAVPTPLRDVVGAAVTDVAALVARSGARVEVDPALDDLPPVLVSPALARTLVVNLLTNAVHHRDRARVLTVWVTASVVADQVQLRVRNDGPEIPEADRERLFGLFQRGAGPSPEGVGIGLAACRRITAWHGGSIALITPAQGGVEVLVSLPTAV